MKLIKRNIDCFKYLICVADKFKRTNMDCIHVNSSHAAVRHTVSEYKKLYIEKTRKGCNKIIQSGIILFQFHLDFNQIFY